MPDGGKKLLQNITDLSRELEEIKRECRKSRKL